MEKIKKRYFNIEMEKGYFVSKDEATTFGIQEKHIEDSIYYFEKYSVGDGKLSIERIDGSDMIKGYIGEEYFLGKYNPETECFIINIWNFFDNTFFSYSSKYYEPTLEAPKTYILACQNNDDSCILDILSPIPTSHIEAKKIEDHFSEFENIIFKYMRTVLSI